MKKLRFLNYGEIKPRLCLGLGADYFTDWLQPRAINGLGDYFEFNLLPKIKGRYSEE